LIENEVRSRQIAARKAARLQQIAEMVDVGYFDFHPNGKLFYANVCIDHRPRRMNICQRRYADRIIQDAWYSLSGHPKDPAAHFEHSFTDCIYEDDYDMCMGIWKNLTNGIPATFEMRWKKVGPDGKPQAGGQWVLAACVPIVTKEGNVLAISGCTTDISAQKRSEQDAVQRADALERARTSEQRFASFTKHALVGIYILDAEGNVSHPPLQVLAPFLPGTKACVYRGARP